MQVEPPTPPVVRSPEEEKGGSLPQEDREPRVKLRKRVIKKKEHEGPEEGSLSQSVHINGMEADKKVKDIEKGETSPEPEVLSQEEEALLARKKLTEKERRVMQAVLGSRRSRSRSSSRLGDSPLPPQESPASSPIPSLDHPEEIEPSENTTHLPASPINYQVKQFLENIPNLPAQNSKAEQIMQVDEAEPRKRCENNARKEEKVNLSARGNRGCDERGESASAGGEKASRLSQQVRNIGPGFTLLICFRRTGREVRGLGIALHIKQRRKN